ncbi:MAG: hypothetical protein ACMUEL_01400 [Flavobacteriales bacterium Tduv]
MRLDVKLLCVGRCQSCVATSRSKLPWMALIPKMIRSSLETEKVPPIKNNFKDQQ